MRRLLAALVLAVAACGGDDGDPVVARQPDTAPPAWERLPEPPLPTRERAVTVWTGDEVLVVGGDQFTCPPAADCVAPSEPPLADGAALDLAAGTWRPIAAAPVGFHAADVAVLDGAVYLLASTDYEGGSALLHYDVDADAWSTPPEPPGEWKRLVAAGDTLVAYTGSEERGETGDFTFDPTTGAWTPLPADPMSPAFDRTMVWSAPHLYLFDKEHVPNPGSEKPSLVRAARLDLAAGTWEALPDSELIGGGGPWLADEGRLINPYLGGADGGEVNGWARWYPNGGVLDLATATWEQLPPAPGDASWSAGAIGSSAAVYIGADGPVLDASTDTWLTMPVLAHDADAVPSVAAAGRDAIAFVDGGVWIWRAP